MFFFLRKTLMALMDPLALIFLLLRAMAIRQHDLSNGS